MNFFAKLFDMFYICLEASHYAQKGDYKTATKMMETI